MDIKDVKNFEDLKANVYFRRTMLTDMEIAKLLPGNDMGKLSEIMEDDDFIKKMDFIADLILILNKGYKNYCDIWDKTADRGILLNKTLLYSLKTEEITELSTIALAEFTEDGEAEVEAEAKKKEDLETK